jgi:hypothetical protein
MDQVFLSYIVLLVLCCLPFFPWSDVFPASDPLRLPVPISSLLLPFTFLCHLQPSLRDRLILMSGFIFASTSFLTLYLNLSWEHCTYHSYLLTGPPLCRPNTSTCPCAWHLCRWWSIRPGNGGPDRYRSEPGENLLSRTAFGE